jgi:putative ABC transport system permease protein
MNRLDFKIALRTFLKNKWYNVLNILGLALGLAAFIFVTLYVDNETGYDLWNKNARQIFLVEREMSNGPIPYTPGGLAGAIKSQCPEVEEVGRTNTALFQVPFYTSFGRFLIKKWVGADYSIAKILGIKPKGFELNSKAITPTILLSKKTAGVLFPGDKPFQNQRVNMLSKTGMPIVIAGVADDIPGNTNLDFDCIGFSNDITQGKDQSYATQIYQTYILVRANTDVKLLSKKIDQIYKNAVLADSSKVAKDAISASGAPAIYLDPLVNLHLRPHYGSHVSYQVVNGLIILAIIILIVTGINFTNLYIAQANTRAKEVGIKKVNGIVKTRIATQFMLEIFFQCVIALFFSFLMVIIGLPYFNRLLQVDLLISGINLSIIIQLLGTLILLTILAGIYPAIIMAGFKPTEVLRGDQFSGGGKLSWVRNVITVFQFVFAIVFIINLVIINQQVIFMKTDNPGFSAKHVIYIDNLGLYNNPKTFEPIRGRIKSIPGVKNVTVASNIPGGILPASNDYTIEDKQISMNTLSVDYEYFETLNISLKEGHFFSSQPLGDSTNAIINEAAVRALNLKSPLGLTVSGCGGMYKIVGVTKDVKANGFEGSIQPTIYLMNDHCGLSKIQIMFSAENNAIPTILDKLKDEWGSINKLDGDNFSYHFLDDLYGQLFLKQEQFRTVLFYFSVLAVFIASLGFFASAAQAIHIRMKEIAVRKVLGAGARQLLYLLTAPFFKMVLVANLIAWPLSFLIANKWLQTFAYKIHISITPFVLAFMISIAIIAFTVCLQVIRAIRFNPAEKLKV